MIRLVIVENDEDERFFMVKAFVQAGAFELVGEFVNGDQLTDWLDGNPQLLPDLVITDLNMPGKNGYDVISEVAAKYPQIRVIATSTSAITATRDSCQRLGASEFLLKPDIFIDYSSYVDQVHQLFRNNFKTEI